MTTPVYDFWCDPCKPLSFVPDGRALSSLRIHAAGTGYGHQKTMYEDMFFRHVRGVTKSDAYRPKCGGPMAGNSFLLQS